MFSTNYKTIFDKMMETTLGEFYEANQETTVIPNTTDDFVDGNVLYKIPINKTSMNELLKTNRFTMNENGLDSNITKAVNIRGSNSLLKNVTEEIIHINLKADFKTCMQEIQKYKKALGKNFYGALLRATHKKLIILNPYHILTALSILEDDKYLNEYNYNIIIYAYNDRDEMDDIYHTNHNDTEKSVANINALMHTYLSKLENNMEIIPTRRSSKSEEITFKYKTIKNADEDQNSTHYIVANQVMTKGIVAPYYGVSLIKLNGNTGGLHLTPQKSCNITSYDNIDIRSSPEYGSVCTGGLNNTTLRGIRSLTHANYSSPYSGYFSYHGVLGYIDIMIQKVDELYVSAEIIDESMLDDENKIDFEAEPSKWTDEQYKSETFYQFVNNSNATLLGISELNKLYKELVAEKALTKGE